MNRKQALKRAALHVSMPHYISGRWHVYKPYKMTSPEVAGSEPFAAHNRAQAYQQRADYVASIALHFLGYSGEEYQEGDETIDYYAHCHAPKFGHMTARELLAEAIKQIDLIRFLNENKN